MSLSHARIHMRCRTALTRPRCNTEGVNGKQGGVYTRYPCTKVTIRPNPGSCDDDKTASLARSEDLVDAGLKTITKKAANVDLAPKPDIVARENEFADQGHCFNCGDGVTRLDAGAAAFAACFKYFGTIMYPPESPGADNSGGLSYN